jgi:hypothetical protein
MFGSEVKVRTLKCRVNFDEVHPISIHGACDPNKTAVDQIAPSRQVPNAKLDPEKHAKPVRSLRSCLMQSDRQPQRGRSQSISMPRYGIRVTRRNAIEFLQHPHDHEPGLREGKLLAEADSRPAVELVTREYANM